MADAERPDEPRNPFEEMLRAFGAGGAPGDMGAMAGFLNQIQAMFAPGDGSSTLNWDQTRQLARQTVAQLGADPSPSAGDQAEARGAAELAELWLSEATSFAAPSGSGVAWARAEWVEQTMPTWRTLVEPVVAHIADAVQEMALRGLDDAAAEDPQAGQMRGMLEPLLRQAAGAMFAGQVGQAVGKLAAQVVSATDIGLPVAGKPVVALLPANVAAFAAGLDVGPREVLLYLALRESARQALFGAVSWLPTQLLALVEHYAREITIDSSALEEALGAHENLDADALADLQQTISGSIFEPAKTPEQKEILARLETLLALVEGWVDDVVAQASQRMLPSLPRLTEAMRRRRAAGGPMESALATLVGLELRPRRVRDAQNLWAALRDARGVAGRDEVWRHPDALPTAVDLDDPLGFVRGEAAAADEPEDGLDAELRKLLESEGE